MEGNNPELLQYIIMVLGILLAISEGLALIPALKSNGILSSIISILKYLLKKQEKK